MSFTLGTPLLPFEQLLAVLPPKSAQLLPAAARPLLLDETSSILDMYPESFEVELDGKRYEYQGHVKLPFINLNRLRVAYSTIRDQITEEENKRNMVGKTTKYYIENCKPSCRWI